MTVSGSTKDECNGTSRTARWLIGLLVALMALFMTGVGWSCWVGSAAKDSAVEVRHDLNIHEAEQRVTMTMIHNGLSRIEASLSDQQAELKEQRGMIEDLWKKDGGN